MPFARSLICTLLGLTALCTLSAQSCEVFFVFSQSFSTAFFELESSIPEGHAITATSWDFGDGTTGTPLQPIHTYPFYGTFHCCMVLTSMNAEGLICEIEHCETIEVMLPQPCAVEVDFAFSEGQDGLVEFAPTIIAGAGTNLNGVTWDLGDGTTVSTLDNWTHAFTDAGLVEVCLTVEGQSTTGTCDASICKAIDVAHFHCLVKVGMGLTTDSCSIEATLATYLEGQTQVDEITWLVDGAWASEDQVMDLLLENDEGAEVCVEVAASSPGSNCVSTECIWVDSPCEPESPTEIEDASETFTLYPNPAVDQVRLDGYAGGVVRVISLSGAVVLEVKSAVLDCSALSSELYVVEVRNGATASRQQLAVQ